MRTMFAAVAAILLTACAGQPPAAETPAPHATALMPVAATTAPTSGSTATVAANTDVAAHRMGYRVVAKNGQKYYCSQDMQTGSHMSSAPICLTEAEWQHVYDSTQQNLRDLNDRARQPQATR